METSTWKVDSNRRNAQRSTGPKTDAGKRVSRRNAYKHGLRALIAAPDEESPELEENRKSWLKTFAPKTDATLLLADVSYRHMRRLERALDAEDAAVSANMRNAVQAFYEARRAQVNEAVDHLLTNTYSCYLTLTHTVAGCERMLELLDGVEAQLQANAWNHDARRLLSALDGREARLSDLVLEVSTRTILGESEAAVDEAARVRAIGLIQARIDATRSMLAERIEDLADEEAEACRLAYEMAKVDLSPEGQLMHRYVREAHRGFMRYYHDTLKACQAENESVEDLEAIDVDLRVVRQHELPGLPPTLSDARVASDSEAEEVAPESSSAQKPREMPSQRATQPPAPATRPTSESSSKAVYPNEPKSKRAGRIELIELASDPRIEVMPFAVGIAPTDDQNR